MSFNLKQNGGKILPKITNDINSFVLSNMLSKRQNANCLTSGVAEYGMPSSGCADCSC